MYRGKLTSASTRYYSWTTRIRSGSSVWWDMLKWRKTARTANMSLIDVETSDTELSRGRLSPAATQLKSESWRCEESTGKVMINVHLTTILKSWLDRLLPHPQPQRLTSPKHLEMVCTVSRLMNTKTVPSIAPHGPGDPVPTLAALRH